MNKLLFFLLSCLFLLTADVLKAEELTFFKGKYEKAKLEAQSEGKPMLLYFRLKGAEPCVFFEKGVLANDTLGDCYNGRFVNYQVEADKKNQSLIEMYKVTEVPLVVWVDAQGNEAYRMTGDMSLSMLLQIGKIVTGELPSLQDLFAETEKSGYSLESMQSLLIEALSFLPILSGDDLYHWTGEIQKIHEKYLSNKQMSDMVNAKDFKILISYQGEARMYDPVFEFILENYDRYKEIVPEEEVANFLMERNMELIGSLTYSGNAAYAEVVDRVSGDLAKVYAGVESFVGIDTVMRYQAEADYWLHGKKDQDAYVDSKNKYFEVLGNKLKWQDLYAAVNDLRKATNRLTEKTFEVCMAWIDVVEAQKDITDATRLWAQMTKGDCCQSVGDKEKAKGFYNQAYIFAMQLNNQGVQEFLKQKIAALEKE